MANKIIIGVDIGLLLVFLALYDIFDLGWPAFLVYLIISLLVTIFLHKHLNREAVE